MQCKSDPGLHYYKSPANLLAYLSSHVQALYPTTLTLMKSCINVLRTKPVGCILVITQLLNPANASAPAPRHCAGRCPLYGKHWAPVQGWHFWHPLQGPLGFICPWAFWIIPQSEGAALSSASCLWRVLSFHCLSISSTLSQGSGGHLLTRSKRKGWHVDGGQLQKLKASDDLGDLLNAFDSHNGGVADIHVATVVNLRIPCLGIVNHNLLEYKSVDWNW